MSDRRRLSHEAIKGSQKICCSVSKHWWVLWAFGILAGLWVTMIVLMFFRQLWFVWIDAHEVDCAAPAAVAFHNGFTSVPYF